MVTPYLHGDVVKLTSLLQQSEAPTDWNKASESISKGLGRFEQWKLWNPLTGFNTSMIIEKITRRANATFVKLEQKGVKIISSDGMLRNHEQVHERYKERLKVYIVFVDTILTQANQFTKKPQHFKDEIHALKCNLIGFKYRIGLDNGGLDAKVESHKGCFNGLLNRAAKWKSKLKQKVSKELNPLEIIQLKEASKYTEWLYSVFAENEKYQEEFFNWALRDHNPPNVFILCNNTQRTIKRAMMPNILGRVRKAGEEILKFIDIPDPKNSGLMQRVLTLPVYDGSPQKEFDPNEQSRINILDGNTEFGFLSSGYNTTVKQLFEEHAKKNDTEPSTTLTSRGLVHYNAINGNLDTQIQEGRDASPWKWIHTIPPVDTYTHDQLMKRYGNEINDKLLVFSVNATRQSNGLEAFGCHSYLEMWVRSDIKAREWKVIELGIYLEKFPKTLFEQLSCVANTAPRECTKQDPSGSFTHRAKAKIRFIPTPEQAEDLLKGIHEEFFSSPNIFQLTANNCSGPIQRRVQAAMGPNTPNFFEIPIVKVKMNVGPIDGYLHFLEKLPTRVVPKWIPYSSSIQEKWAPLAEKIQRFGVRLLLMMFGYWRTLTLDGRTFSTRKYYLEHPEMKMKHPPQLFENIISAQRKMKDGIEMTPEEQAFAQGEITWGATDEKMRDLTEWESAARVSSQAAQACFQAHYGSNSPSRAHLSEAAAY